MTAVCPEGDIRIASDPDRWISNAAQASRVRLVRLRGCKRGTSQSSAPRHLPTASRQRNASNAGVMAGALKSPGRVAPTDVLSKDEVVARLLGRPLELSEYQPKMVCIGSKVRKLVACH